MKIVVVHQNYLMPGWPGGSRFNEFARLWSDAGHEVTAFDNGRVGPTQAQRIAALVWGRLDVAPHSAAVNQPLSIRISASGESFRVAHIAQASVNCCWSMRSV